MDKRLENQLFDWGFEKEENHTGVFYSLYTEEYYIFFWDEGDRYDLALQVYLEGHHRYVTFRYLVSNSQLQGVLRSLLVHKDDAVQKIARDALRSIGYIREIDYVARFEQILEIESAEERERQKDHLIYELLDGLEEK